LAPIRPSASASRARRFASWHRHPRSRPMLQEKAWALIRHRRGGFETRPLLLAALRIDTRFTTLEPANGRSHPQMVRLPISEAASVTKRRKTRPEIASEMTNIICKHLETMPAEERKTRLDAFTTLINRGLAARTVIRIRRSRETLC